MAVEEAPRAMDHRGLQAFIQRITKFEVPVITGTGHQEVCLQEVVDRQDHVGPGRRGRRQGSVQAHQWVRRHCLRRVRVYLREGRHLAQVAGAIHTRAGGGQAP